MNALTKVLDLYGEERQAASPTLGSYPPPPPPSDSHVAPKTVSSECELMEIFQAPELPGLTLHHVQFSRTITLDLPQLANTYLLHLAISGDWRNRSDEQTTARHAGDLTVGNPGSIGRREWREGSEHLLLLVRSCEIERAVGAEVGDHSRRRVLFSGQATPAETAPTLLNYLWLLRQDLGSSRTLVNPTTARLSLEMMSSLMLRLLPNDKQRQILTSKSPATPYYVRRALDYAGERFGEAVSLRDMAVASGVCSRTLDKGFRRFCDKSPMEHLRSVRLENARIQLMQPHDDQTTVSATARLCGFRHLGRFAEYYSRQFGELPSQTLVRQQRAD